MSLVYEPKGRAREYAPLALNLYQGCDHACLYCYAPKACQRFREEFHSTTAERVDLLIKLEKELTRQTDLFSDTDKPPVLLCFTSDPYHAGDTSLTREAIKLLHAAGHPVHILTKGGTRAVRDFDLLGPERGNARDAFAATMTFTNEDDSRHWEPAAAMPWDRMTALAAAHNLGIKTWVSLEPVIDPVQSLDVIKQTHDFVDLFKIGVLNYDRLADTIDWSTFGRRAIQDCEAYGKAYYIKHDLMAHLTPDLQAEAKRMHDREGLPL